MLRRIDEKEILKTDLIGDDINNIEDKIKKLIDLILGESQKEIDLNFFDIKGTVLLYGLPGIGKTSVINNCISHALINYGADCYNLPTTDIIESNLGQATKNLANAIKEFENYATGILFIDELDRLCVNRNSDEVSELKRMLIELMQFFDRLKYDNKKLVLCCTNVKEQIDEALIRRFSICEELHIPREEELLKFANICMKSAGFSQTIQKIKGKEIKTFDQIKKIFRNIILSKNQDFSSWFLVKEN
ncbi:MAG: ATP-binding protein [bacterium]|nr:ATP-binding protein [bacterium]